MLSHILSLLALLSLQTLITSDKIKGACFSTGHYTDEYRKPYTDVSLRQLKATGATWVKINAYTRMKGLYAPSATRITDDASIRYIVRKAKRYGFNVFLKPVVEVPGSWRGFLTGTSMWFNGIYLPFITHMARIAQQERINMFSIGSEYKYAEHKTLQWYRVIARVRSVYSGPITYISNHDSFQRVKFWHRLDYISMSAYFVLLPGRYGYSPNLYQTRLLWEKKAAYVNKWRESVGLRNQVLMAEMGFQSKGKGVLYRVSYDWNVKAPKNLLEQRKMYEAFLGVFMNRSWIKGVIIWVWEPRPDAGKTYPSSVDYTPQNKPAVHVMKRYFQRKY